MTEQLLDRPEVGAALEQVRRVRVSQAVRVGEEPTQRARVEAPPADGDEERVARAPRERRASVPEPAAQAPGRLLPERHEPLLAALPAHVDLLAVEIDIGEVEPHGLGGAEPAIAIVDATVRRFRPIMLTAAAAVLAMIPLTRSAFYGPMAVSIMGGLVVATVLTLLFLPALYAAWFRVPRAAGVPEAEPLPA